MDNMNFDADAERKILREALGGERGTGACPEAAQLEAYRSATLPPSESERLAAHIDSCSFCSSELALLEAFAREPENTDEREAAEWIAARVATNMKRVMRPVAPVREQRRAGWWESLGFSGKGMQFAGALAALVLVAGGAIYWQQQQGRGVVEEERLRSGEIELLTAGELPNAPARLDWKPMENAASYRVEILEVDQAVLWSTSSTEASIEVPDSVRARLLPGKTVSWRVRALSADGKQIGQSSLSTLRVGNRR